jgi:hypothetical protein
MLQAAYRDDSAKHMIVAASPADVPENFTGSVFSTEQEKFDALDKMMNGKVKQEQIAWLKTRDARSPSKKRRS